MEENKPHFLYAKQILLDRQTTLNRLTAEADEIYWLLQVAIDPDKSLPYRTKAAQLDYEIEEAMESVLSAEKDFLEIMSDLPKANANISKGNAYPEQ